MIKIIILHNNTVFCDQINAALVNFTVRTKKKNHTETKHLNSTVWHNTWFKFTIFYPIIETCFTSETTFLFIWCHKGFSGYLLTLDRLQNTSITTMTVRLCVGVLVSADLTPNFLFTGKIDKTNASTVQPWDKSDHIRTGLVLWGHQTQKDLLPEAGVW